MVAIVFASYRYGNVVTIREQAFPIVTIYFSCSSGVQSVIDGSAHYPLIISLPTPTPQKSTEVQGYMVTSRVMAYIS